MFSNVYLNNIAVACIAFPFAAALITLPYLVVQYRRFGSVPWWRTFVVYLFVLYLLMIAAPATLVPALPSAMRASEKWVDPALLVAVLLMFFAIWAISVVVRAVRSAMGHPFVMVNGLITGTRIAPSPRAGHERAPWRERLIEKRAAAAAKRGEHAQGADGSEGSAEEEER